MSNTYYKNLHKNDILAEPYNYAWNTLLRHIQFSQEEILSVKEWIEVRELIKFQKSVTISFLREHFQKEIDDCLEVDWTDVNKYVNK
jgi:hypothetical protein